MFTTKRGRYERQHVAACLEGAIERECGIHARGIEIGHIHFKAYKKEVRRRKKYWDRVARGESTHSQRGFARQRREAMERLR